jgi:SAM-dependent methyltransferase
MEQREAIDLLRPALGQSSGIWADFGAGTGMFTRALAAILGRGSSILAIDRDPRALSTLRSLQGREAEDSKIVAILGDLEKLDAIPELADVQLDGAVFANALHFVADARDVLRRAVEHIRPGGRVIVIEYERDLATPWVPHPLPFERLQTIAQSAGLTVPEVITRRPSAFRGTMYCAAANRALSS